MGGYNTEGAKLVDSVLDIVRNSGIPANTRSVVEPDQEWGTLLISNVPQKYPDRIKNIDQKKVQTYLAKSLLDLFPGRAGPFCSAPYCAMAKMADYIFMYYTLL